MPLGRIFLGNSCWSNSLLCLGYIAEYAYFGLFPFQPNYLYISRDRSFQQLVIICRRRWRRIPKYVFLRTYENTFNVISSCGFSREYCHLSRGRKCKLGEAKDFTNHAFVATHSHSFLLVDAPKRYKTTNHVWINIPILEFLGISKRGQEGSDVLKTFILSEFPIERQKELPNGYLLTNLSFTIEGVIFNFVCPTHNATKINWTFNLGIPRLFERQLWLVRVVVPKPRLLIDADHWRVLWRQDVRQFA